MTVVESQWRALRRFGGGFDPFHAVWRALTSVRIAIYLLVLVSFGALLGTLFPQIPSPMRGSRPAVSAWLQFQEGKYGPWTTPLYRAGLFDVFHTWWFNGLLVVVLLAVTVCTANRLMPTWRSVARPQTRVPETYYTRARHRARRDAAVDADALVTALGRRRYMVRRYDEGGAVHLYADRFRWAQLATFVSHLSLILLLAGGLVTRLYGYNVQLFIAEGRTAPVFPVANNRQIQIEVKSFGEPVDEQGRILDFRSRVVLYSRGVPVKEGDITVNGPLKWGGFVFHQLARQMNGAELQVRDRRTGQLMYSEVLDLAQAAPLPRLTVRDVAGAVLLDERLLLPLFNQVGPAGTPTTVITEPGTGSSLAVTLRLVGKLWWMEVRELGTNPPRVWLSMPPGGSGEAGGLTYTYAGLGDAAWTQVTGIPGVADGAVALMPSVAAAGLRGIADRAAPSAAEAASALVITGPINWEPAFAETGLVTLPVGQTVTVGDYDYTFVSQRAFTGIVARRDPGTGFIWVAVTLFIAAVCVTFYFPRRRLWVTVGAGATLAAGVADRGSRYGEELQRLLDELPAVATSAAPTPQPAAQGAEAAVVVESR